jgi:plasmid stability protein
VSRQLSIRGVPDHVADRLKRLSEARGQSVNSTVLELLHQAVDTEGRRARLERYVDWSDEELRTFQKALDAQRVIDHELWR